MATIVNAILGFFRRLFGLGGGAQPPPDSTSISYFFYKLATTNAVYTTFTANPIGAVQNDPNLSGPNKTILVNALNTGGWTGYQAVYNQMTTETGSANAVVWICIWIVVPRQ